jgi:hypothetical protein
LSLLSLALSSGVLASSSARSGSAPYLNRHYANDTHTIEQSQT